MAINQGIPMALRRSPNTLAKYGNSRSDQWSPGGRGEKPGFPPVPSVTNRPSLMGQGEHVTGEQAEGLDGGVARFEAEAENPGGGGRQAQRQVRGIFLPIGQRNGQAFILITQAVF